MGVAISNWRLARAVSSAGGLGVVSGTALDQVLARRLQDGDPGGHMRRALDAFPVPAIAARIRDRFLIEGGKGDAAVLRHPSDAQPRRHQRPAGTLCRCQLRRGLAGAGGPRPAGRHQLPREDPDPAPALHLRRPPRGRGLHPHGRGHPVEDSRRHRRARDARARPPIRSPSPAARPATTPCSGSIRPTSSASGDRC